MEFGKSDISCCRTDNSFSKYLIDLIYQNWGIIKQTHSQLWKKSDFFYYECFVGNETDNFENSLMNENTCKHVIPHTFFNVQELSSLLNNLRIYCVKKNE